jgi:hypothetical protein
MYTEEQLKSLMADVEKEFNVHLAKAENDFKAKPEDESDKKDKSKEKPEGKIESEKPEDKGATDQHQQDTSKEDKGQPMESKEGREEADKEENAKPSDDAHGDAEDHGYDDEDMGHMHSMYSSMSKPELKAHHDVIRKCMDSHGLAKCEDSMAKAETGDAAKDAEGYRPNGGPKDGEAKGEGKGPAKSDTQALEKSEKDFVIEVTSENTLLKSELEASKKNLEAVEAFLKKFVEKTAPAGKAIVSLDIIAKTEGANKEKPLQKSEIDAKLLAKARDLSLSKSDRDAINSYYFSKNIETVRHLLS